MPEFLVHSMHRNERGQEALSGLPTGWNRAYADVSAQQIAPNVAMFPVRSI